MNESNKWITVGQAAEISGFNEEYIRRLLRDGLVKGRKFGVIWQVNHTSILAYLGESQKLNDGRHGPKKHPSQ